MIAIKNAATLEGQKTTILVDGEKIVANSAGAAIPESASVINAEGLYVMPGLIEAHTHFGGSPSFDYPACGNRHETYNFTDAREGFLKWGVTAVRTCGDQHEEMLPFRDDVKAGKILSPRIVSCGPFIQAVNGHPWATVYMKNEKVAKKACVFIPGDIPVERQVAAIAELGVDFIKVFYAHINKLDYPNSVPRITKEELKRIVDSAHRSGLKCACHVDGPAEMMDAVEVGVDHIEHMLGAGSLEDGYTDEQVAKVKASGAIVDPTLVSIIRFDNTPGYVPIYDKLVASVKKFYAAGVEMALGVDSGVPFCPFGESLHDEMQLRAEAGISNADIIRSATEINAKVLGMENEIGSLDVGKYADILLLGANPYDDISNTRDIRMTMLGGKIINTKL